jgi:hypothetical protein
MPFDDVLYDRETKPCSPGRTAAAGIGTIEPPGKVRDMFRSNAFPAIGDRQADPILALWMQADG